VHSISHVREGYAKKACRASSWGSSLPIPRFPRCLRPKALIRIFKMVPEPETSVKAALVFLLYVNHRSLYAPFQAAFAKGTLL